MEIFAKKYFTLSGAVPLRVPRHPLKFINRCQTPVLGRTLVAKKPNFCKKVQNFAHFE